jgi:hypothetical protein
MVVINGELMNWDTNNSAAAMTNNTRTVSP